MSGTQAHDTYLSSDVPDNASGVAQSFMHPEDVVEDPRLTRTEKREILASWASDLHAVADAPALRQLENGAVVRLDDILRSLQSLDADTSDPITSEAFRPFPRRNKVAARIKSVLRRRWSDDDDDPPPCPAIINRPPGGPLRGGGIVDPGLAVAS